MRDALPKGRVTLTVQMNAADKRARIAVADNGKGLPVEERAFHEPYVTTRPKGTGLGLAIVTKIMLDHGGALELADAPGAARSSHLSCRRPRKRRP